MVTQVGAVAGTDSRMYQGLSTDTKPTTCGTGSVFYELDTKKNYLFDENNEYMAGVKWWPL